jgi:TPR repeat protein
LTAQQLAEVEAEAESAPPPIEVLRAQGDGGDADAIVRLAQAQQETDVNAGLEYLKRAGGTNAPECVLASAQALIDNLQWEERLDRLSRPSRPAGPGGRIPARLRPEERERTFEHFERAAEFGHPEGEAYCALYLDEGLGWAPDQALAGVHYERASNPSVAPMNVPLWANAASRRQLFAECG